MKFWVISGKLVSLLISCLVSKWDYSVVLISGIALQYLCVYMLPLLFNTNLLIVCKYYALWNVCFSEGAIFLNCFATWKKWQNVLWIKSYLLTACLLETNLDKNCIFVHRVKFQHNVYIVIRIYNLMSYVCHKPKFFSTQVVVKVFLRNWFFKFFVPATRWCCSSVWNA